MSLLASNMTFGVDAFSLLRSCGGSTQLIIKAIKHREWQLVYERLIRKTECQADKVCYEMYYRQTDLLSCKAKLTCGEGKKLLRIVLGILSKNSIGKSRSMAKGKTSQRRSRGGTSLMPTMMSPPR